MLVRGVLPKTRVWSLQLIISRKCYQFCGIGFVISPHLQFNWFYASRNLGGDHFRELVCVLAGCWLVLYCDFLHLSTEYLWPLIHNILGLKGCRPGFAWQCTLSGCIWCYAVGRLQFQEPCWDIISNPVSCWYLHCIPETAAQVVHLIIAHYCFNIM